MKLILELTADDSGTTAASAILLTTDAESQCRTWCKKFNLPFNGLKDYEMEDDNGFFCSFSVGEATVGTTLNDGQYR